MSAPTPQSQLQLCNGTVLKKQCNSKGQVYPYTCFYCGGGPYPVYWSGLQCLRCKAGYYYNAANKLCCPGKPSVPIPK